MLSKKILITGGTGSLGRVLTEKLKNRNQIIIYSRDEGKQALHFPNNDVIKIIGDVRDYNKLDQTFKKYIPDYVIHTAALKRIDDMELFPDECIKTNIEGSTNVAKAALVHKVSKCVLISTDKACQPINVYGASKFIAERIFTNFDYNSSFTKFCSVRYGNVIASRGSFIPLWIDKIKNNEKISITDTECTRFLFTLEDAANFVLSALDMTFGGEVFVPNLESFYIIDVIMALETLFGKAEYEVIGIRPGEKIHEDMLNMAELKYTFKKNGALAILPQYGKRNYGEYYNEKYEGPHLNSELHVLEDLYTLTALISEGLQ